MKFGQENMQLNQHRCSGCGTMLKETKDPVDFADISDECPTCRRLLAETLQVKKLGMQKNSLPAFQTAYELSARLAFDIMEIDRKITISLGDEIYIVGPTRLANLLVTRLWVRALMPQRHGGLASKTVVCIDGGNCANVYQCVNFARQYGMDIRTVLRSIIISRAFTVYQLASLIIHSLPRVIEQFDAKIVVISDLLKMFLEDPQIRHREVQYLLQEIVKSISRLPSDIVVITSSYNPESRYDKMVLQNFGKRIEVMESGSQPKIRLFENQKMLSEFSMPHSAFRIASR